MLNYEQRLKKIKCQDDLENQIRLAGEAVKRQKRLVKKTIILSDKIDEQRKVRAFEDVEYKLKLNYFEILDSLYG